MGDDITATSKYVDVSQLTDNQIITAKARGVDIRYEYHKYAPAGTVYYLKKQNTYYSSGKKLADDTYIDEEVDDAHGYTRLKMDKKVNWYVKNSDLIDDRTSSTYGNNGNALYQYK